MECPQHFIPTVFAKNDGMRPSFRIPKGEPSVEDTPLVLRLIQMIRLTSHYLFDFASTFPNSTECFVWVEPLAHTGGIQRKNVTVHDLIGFASTSAGAGLSAIALNDPPKNVILPQA